MTEQQIEQFVTGRMTEAQAAAFEELCLRNPALARQVEFEQRLQAGLALVARGSTTEFVRSDQLGRWKIAAAASVLLCIGVALYAWFSSVDRHPRILAAVAGEADYSRPALRLALVRGAENLPRLPRGEVRLEIVGLYDPGAQYTVALDRLKEGREVVTVATLFDQRPDSPLTLNVMIDSEDLERGSYSLRVRKQAAEDEILDFNFVK